MQTSGNKDEKTNRKEKTKRKCIYSKQHLRNALKVNSMKVINKQEIPPQKCRNCGSTISIKYSDLKWEDTYIPRKKDRWCCPLCKEKNNTVKFGE